ncbi:Mechanosensitive ion channel protein 4 [Picochlorum sp. SENEW3]|nr:Mechanosensitive ion channel protein 4 [Picochlorum sp. SENEW3]
MDVSGDSTRDSGKGSEEATRAERSKPVVRFNGEVIREIEDLSDDGSYDGGPMDRHMSAPVATEPALLQYEQARNAGTQSVESHDERMESLNAMSPYSSDMMGEARTDSSWLRNRKPKPTLESTGASHAPMAGDLASPKKKQEDSLNEEKEPVDFTTKMFDFLGASQNKENTRLLRPSARKATMTHHHHHDNAWDSEWDDSSDDEVAADLLSMPDEEELLWGSDDEAEDREIKKQNKIRWYKKKWIYLWTLITIGQLLLIAAGTAHMVLGNGANAGFQVWRLCYFFAFLPYTWVFGTFLTWLLIRSVEKFLLTYPNVLYFTYAIRKQVKWLLCSILVLVLWACMMLIDTEDQSSAVNTIYDYILKVMGCITLFLLANLLKRLIAKMMSVTFTGSNQKSKMEVALKQEKLLSDLMGPRPKSEENLVVEKGLGSIMNFRKKKHELDTMRAGTTSDTTGMHHGKMDYGQRAKSTSVLPTSLGNIDESAQLETLDELSLPQVKIQIDKEDVPSDSNEPVSVSPGNVTKAKSAKVKSPMAAAFGMFGSKKSRDDDEEQDPGNSSRKRTDPLTRAQQLERLNRLEKYMRKTQLKVTFRDQLNEVKESSTIDHRSVKKLATFLFWNIKHDVDAHYLTRDDIAFFIKNEEDLNMAFSMLDANMDGKISKQDCISAVEKIYHERCNLASTLRDTKAITRVLEKLVGGVIHTIFFFLYLLVFRAKVTEIWVGFTGLLVSLSFIFATTVSNVFENIIFLFGVHPYDIGDTLLINDQYLTIDEITINFTCCMSGYNLRVWFPNQQLQSNLFVNLTTSGTKWEVIYVYVDIDTDPIILDKIESECARVRQEKADEYGPGFRVKFAAAAMPYKVGIEMVYEYSHQGINFHRTACARSWMYEAFCRVLTENNIQFTWPETKRSTDLNFDGWNQQRQGDSSRGGRSTLQTNIFEQQPQS